MSRPITQSGYENALIKLAELKKEFEKLPAIIAEAREKGDLKENAEYHAAKERQGMLQASISKFESDIAGSEIIDPATLPENTVTFGKKVTVNDKTSGKTTSYKVLGDLESDINQGIISITTPIARGLVGKSVGDTVTIKVPAGDKILEIISIELG